ncbi:A disintegrin and metalloproteinase with thrombospondin motifs 6 isoform X3 [Hydra vulgaris]|uniref:A disintegrin and metalloproteinase with thrombospondin motifs 6 isoform X3 n=1 Tax=Hydra vulgaris TaxID=6087 RepID=A0ABM4BTL0_HYDVU
MGALHLLLCFVIIEKSLERVLQVKPSVHEKMTKTEIAQIFGVNEHSKVPFYEVTNISQHILSKSKDKVLVKFKAFGIKFRLNLNAKNDFIAKSHLVEFYNANGTVEKYSGFTGHFSSGFVDGDKSSYASIHLSGRGISGTVHTKENTYVINPLPKRIYGGDAKHAIVWKSDLLNYHHSLPMFLKNDLKQPKSSKSTNIKKRHRRSVQAVKTMELMIAADYKMVEYYGKDFLPSYLLALANILSGLYQDDSLDYKLNVVVVRTVIFDKNMFPAANIGSLLSQFSEWVNKNNVADKIVGHADNAVLITRNGCTDGCVLEGLAYTARCMENAQAVAKDRGLMAALTVAHEIAHNLGVTHDNSETCPDGVNIMASGSSSGPGAFKWSTCSSNQIRSFLESPSSSCLNNMPPELYTNSVFPMYGQVYNADKQCQFAFDFSYKSCSFYESHCDKLYCQQSGSISCSALAYPPAHGTSCGANKWCIFGLCVPDGSKPALPVDGQWGNWGSYSPCSQECGIGVQWRNRTCNNPSPANGGLNCVGESKGQYKTCNKQDCLIMQSVRLKQCLKIGSDYVDVFNEEKPCKLICMIGTSAYYFGNVEDGTKCIPGSSSNDVCIGGTCQSVGCDKELDSNKYFDRCGVCNGNGNSCELVSGSDFEEYSSAGQFFLTEIPKGSYGVTIKEVGETFNFLGFSIGDETELAISLPSYSTTYNLENTTIYYSMDGWYYADEIKVIDRLPMSIKVYLINFYEVPSEGVMWRYYQPPTSVLLSPVLAWKGESWGACSKTCGGGMQTRKMLCIRTDDNSTVNFESCSLLDPINVLQSCNNQNCPAEWYVTSWSECTKSCGNGTWTRQLYCSMMTETGRSILPDSACSTNRPQMDLTAVCNAVMCPAVWRSTPWTQCSKSCGGGLKTRKVTCERVNSDGSVVDAPPLECSYLAPIDSSQQCNSDILCPVWVLNFTSCSKSCGGGTKMPFLYCYSPSIQNLLDSQCNVTSKPVIKLDAQECNQEPCDYNNWVVVKSQCSVTCGKGLRSLHLECQNNATGIAVSESSCYDKKPIISFSEECEVGVCPEIFEWKIKHNGCSLSCGGGIVLYNLVCLALSTNLTVSDIYCDVTKKPTVHFDACNELPCPIKYIWDVSYGACSVTCLKGVKVPIFECKRETDKLTVNASFCDPVKNLSLEQTPCDMGECPPEYSWLSMTTPCSVTCGTGNETISSVCVRNIDQVKFDDSMCNSTIKPVDIVRTCNMEKCLANHYWKAEYGECVAECGKGFKLKTLTCVERSTGFILSMSECADDPIPVDEACQKKPCIPAFESTVMPPTYSVGCYNDIPSSRRVPVFLYNYRDIYTSTNASYFIQQCAIKAYMHGYEYYSLQFNGECWGGNESVAKTYYLSGAAYNCKEGVGNDGSNFVYRIGAPVVTKSLPPLVMLGCFSDDLNLPRPLPSFLDNFQESLNWNLLNVNEILRLCALSTNRRGWSVFGLQYYGECWSGENASNSYDRAGESHDCIDGIGGVNANSIYRFYV